MYQIKKVVFLLLFTITSSYSYCSYDDCTMDVVSESISIANDIYNTGQEIQDKIDEWKEKQDEYDEVTKFQVKEIVETRKIVQEYYLVIKEINSYKTKIASEKR